MAGEIMDQVGQLVLPLIKNKVTNGDAGSIVLGTVEGDIHYIGRDIFKILVRGYGFTVHDLGVDVPPSKFIAAIHEFRPNIVGLSCLISAAYKNMAETIALFHRNLPPSLPPPVYLIGIVAPGPAELDLIVLIVFLSLVFGCIYGLVCGIVLDCLLAIAERRRNRRLEMPPIGDAR